MYTWRSSKYIMTKILIYYSNLLLIRFSYIADALVNQNDITRYL